MEECSYLFLFFTTVVVTSVNSQIILDSKPPEAGNFYLNDGAELDLGYSFKISTIGSFVIESFIYIDIRKERFIQDLFTLQSTTYFHFCNQQPLLAALELLY